VGPTQQVLASHIHDARVAKVDQLKKAKGPQTGAKPLNVVAVETKNLSPIVGIGN
jgi:hypothetical protein